jgi:hypothetical protein
VLSWRRIARAALEQRQAVGQAIAQRGKRQHPHSRRGELDGQGHSLHTSADFGHLRQGIGAGQGRGIGCAGTLEKKLNCRVLGKLPRRGRLTS